MAVIGIVNNPGSRHNRRHPDTPRRLASLVDGEGLVADASNLEELARALGEFRGAGVEVLGVNGGDGTAHVVLTAAVTAWAGAPLPALLILRGGSMNTVAHGHGLKGTPESILRRWVEGRRERRPLRQVERDLLQVEWGGRPPQYGFLFGTGAVVRFLETYYARGRTTPLRAAALAARAVGSALVRGRFAADLTRREPARVVADGDDWPSLRYLAVLAGSEPDIGLGFKPFARCDEQPGFFHAVGVTSSALTLAAALPAIRLGRPWRRRVAMDAVTRDLAIEAPEPFRFTLDGDLYDSDGSVRITTGPPVRILLP
ncbi:diacylglycerol/lipid kinase family protein [Anaeromyxobacter paludicola]|uniref:DAGKc domain-containing protein n=1 Tax=Anaeromyxobacter paludicola TaxID=2918171 RepID=A0ABM7XEQ6_9BACT|nr:diacylglycerol kinase family protein [Anaeromyxobacter paludicola]BDG10377.1 hypothetical protein AMPC_34900 [Anaeromyxobacter paludicola]